MIKEQWLYFVKGVSTELLFGVFYNFLDLSSSKVQAHSDYTTGVFLVYNLWTSFLWPHKTCLRSGFSVCHDA